MTDEAIKKALELHEMWLNEEEGGECADFVPTLIECMGMKQPAEMTGSSLLIRK